MAARKRSKAGPKRRPNPEWRGFGAVLRRYSGPILAILLAWETLAVTFISLPPGKQDQVLRYTFVLRIVVYIAGVAGLRQDSKSAVPACNGNAPSFGSPRAPTSPPRRERFDYSFTRFTGVSGVSPPRRRANVSRPVVSHWPVTARSA